MSIPAVPGTVSRLSSTTSVPPTTATTSSSLSDIQQMMFAFGDARRPLPESANIVEKIVISQMTDVLHKAAEVAHRKQSKMLCMEDVLYLMRKDPVKVQRLIKYLAAKDLAGRAQATAEGEVDPGIKSLKRFKDFIEKIDQGGKLMAAYEGEYFDEVYMERLVRNDKITKNMDDKKYEEFCNARKVSFRGKYSQKFQQSMQEVAAGLDLQIEKQFQEVLSYLAYETVGQLVELALTVRRDATSPPGDPVCRMTSLASVNPAYPNIHLPTPDKADNKPELTGNPITTAELREAVRRIQRAAGGRPSGGRTVLTLS